MMTDAARHSAPQPDLLDARHTLTVRAVEALFAKEGIQRSHRHVLRLCQSGMLDAVKIPGGPSGDEWYVSPASVPKAVGDLKQIDAQRAARHSAPQPAVAGSDGPEIPNNSDRDVARRSAPEPAMSSTKNKDEHTGTEHATARHSAADFDIFEHPYVKRLEERNEKLELKLEAQVRRTEEIQMKSQEKLLELQRMTAVGQSQTLANFMLEAKDWMLGRASEGEKREAEASPVTHAGA